MQGSKEIYMSVLVGGAMAIIEEVFDREGEGLGEAYVDLGGLQRDTVAAILQLICLDETVDIFTEQVSEVTPYIRPEKL